MTAPNTESSLSLVSSAPAAQGSDVLAACEFTTLSIDQLRTKILDCDCQAAGMASVAQRAIKQSLAHIIAAGKALIAAKAKLQHGQWEAWLDSNLAEIPRSRISRYMATAERISHVTNMGAIKSVRQLYLACGIIPDPAIKSPSKSSAHEAFTPENSIARIRSLRNFFQGTDGQQQPGMFDTALGKQLISEIQSLMELLKDIQQRVLRPALREPAQDQLPANNGVPLTDHSKLRKAKTPRRTRRGNKHVSSS